MTTSKQTQALYESLCLYADNLVKLGYMHKTRRCFHPVRVCYFEPSVVLTIWRQASWMQYSIHRKIMNYTVRPNIPDRR